MKFPPAILSVALALLPLTAVAAESAPPKSPLEGTWKWTHRTSDGAEVAPRLKFKTNKDGKLTATTSFRPGSDEAAKNLKFRNNRISFDVVRERDDEKVTTHYDGELRGDVIVGKITAKFGGEERVLDWEAKRPSGLEGDWKWSAPGFGGGRPLDWTLTLKPEGGTLAGKMKFGGGRGGGEIEIHRAAMADGQIYFETERKSSSGEMRTNRFRGKLSGDKIIGQSEINSGGKYTTNKWEPARVE